MENNESFASPKEETKKDWVQEQVDKFQKFLDSLPEEELQKMVKQVEESGIIGPTVEEYFAALGGRKDETSKEMGAGDDYPVVISKVEYQKEKCSTCGLSKNHPAAKLCSNSFHLSQTPASKEKPDQPYFTLSRNAYGKGFLYYMPEGSGHYKCWMPLDEDLYNAIAALQEEIRQLKNNESIQCPYCSGSGCDEHESEMTACGYCYGNGRVTTDLMKEHIAQSKTALTDEERKDLPF